ncbi:SRPBCC domain-containing protein [Candidatus Kaiserbacteria bacterium]|nr:SRPBCC domain-containing protein [Candidatus Kaiserbacteria bacterium]
MKTIFTIHDDKKTLSIKRIFGTAKSRLWEAYTTAEAIAAWFGPAGWETEVPYLDFKDGGEWRYIMKCVDKNQGEWFGMTSAGKAVYSNINPENSFEYTDYFTDEDGNVNESMPVSHSKLVLQENEDGSTTLMVTTEYETEEALKQVLEMGMETGYDQTLDKLEGFVCLDLN